MDIVNRIKKFLDDFQIANSQFADKCDIPRPTVSQLLNGRNKKVSDEVISKIHAAYPNLSIMWLMFGEEPMLLQPMNKGESEVRDNSSLNSVLFAENEHEQENTSGHKIVFDAEPSKKPEESGQNKDSNSLSNNLSQALESFSKNKASFAQDANNLGQKRIVNIMVFYSDNSFESFVPSK